MPTSEQISLLDSPHKSGNAAPATAAAADVAAAATAAAVAAAATAAAAAAAQHQAIDSLSSEEANVGSDLQQQPTSCTDNPGPRKKPAAIEEEPTCTQCLNNTFRPFSSTGQQRLDAAQVLKCIQYLQYTCYTQNISLQQESHMK